MIAPVQVDDNAKLEFFEIDHRYSENASINGVSVHFNYHGHARVTYPGANYDPTGTDVEARASVAGVDDSNEELREAEFDLSFEAKPKADKIFAAEVDKVIKALESAEKNWMTPNKCAQITFTPETNSLKPLKKDKQDTFEAEVKSADGGKPDSGTWTVLKQANGSFTPTTAHSNPAKFNYTVKKVGNEIFIETTLKVVSAAGVAEKDWIQPTEPDLINHITGDVHRHRKPRRLDHRMVRRSDLRPGCARAERCDGRLHARVRHGHRRLLGHIRAAAGRLRMDGTTQIHDGEKQRRDGAGSEPRKLSNRPTNTTSKRPFATRIPPG